MFDIQNIDKNYQQGDSTQCPRGLSLSVNQGETVSIIGQSGSGKAPCCRYCVDLKILIQGSLRRATAHHTPDEWTDRAIVSKLFSTLSSCSTSDGA